MHSYLDNNATTQPLPEVVAAVTDAMLRGWGNPSSVHRTGMEARRLVELARESVAQLVGASDREIVFTSGGTEGAGLAIAGTLGMLPERRVVVTMRTEHSAVREACEALRSALWRKWCGWSATLRAMRIWRRLTEFWRRAPPRLR